MWLCAAFVCLCDDQDDQENQVCPEETKWRKLLRASEGDQTMEATNDTASFNLLISLLPPTVWSYAFIGAWVEDNTFIISVW